ncbi:MAG TPA: hypothetical protein VLV86_14705 [Vicinamibacterales bacterium]|nr:hypothetical protein [Vicinamibacterales bacterium]
MNRLAFAAVTAVALAAAAPASAADSASAPTFSKDVLPILQKNCQSCHRPGEIGPMPLLTYEQARPYARAIKRATESKKMPPWFADSSVQHYSNDMSLATGDIATLGAWSDAGAPEGNPADAPPPRQFADGWNIVAPGNVPDRIVQMPQPYQIPAKGTIEYTYIIIPSGFTEDTWVTAAEIRPGNRTLMHHAVLYLRTPGSQWLHEYPKNVPFVPEPREGRDARSSDGDRTSEGSLADEWIVGYVPGAPPYTLPDDTAFLIKAGSDFVLQLHYTADGTAALDQTRIGLNLAKHAPSKRAFIALVSDARFTIPAGDPSYSAKARFTLATDAEILGAGPHMHLRGKAMDMQATYPDGSTETLFNVPRYDFNWQQLYQFGSGKNAPKGTRIEITGVWDNSESNKFNPNPKVDVKWGDQSWDEMLLGLVTLSIDPHTDVTKLFEPPPRRRAPQQTAENR